LVTEKLIFSSVETRVIKLEFKGKRIEETEKKTGNKRKMSVKGRGLTYF